eukprot:XP_014791168.1 PREDICTED: uncharacterized protein LOC106884343 [Octopus bimaculoides]
MIYEAGVAWSAETDLCRAEVFKRSKSDEKLRVCLLKIPSFKYEKINILTAEDVLFWKNGVYDQEMFCFNGDNTLQFHIIYASQCTEKQLNFTCITKDWIENYKIDLVQSSGHCAATMVPNLCWCRCLPTPRNLTQEELEKKLRQISSELSIPRKNTSKYIRSKISIEDKRASSFYMGSAMVLIITIPFGLIILMDLSPFFKWVYNYLI